MSLHCDAALSVLPPSSQKHKRAASLDDTALPPPASVRRRLRPLVHDHDQLPPQRPDADQHRSGSVPPLCTITDGEIASASHHLWLKPRAVTPSPAHTRLKRGSSELNLSEVSITPFGNAAHKVVAGRRSWKSRVRSWQNMFHRASWGAKDESAQRGSSSRDSSASSSKSVAPATAPVVSGTGVSLKRASPNASCPDIAAAAAASVSPPSSSVEDSAHNAFKISLSSLFHRQGSSVTRSMSMSSGSGFVRPAKSVSPRTSNVTPTPTPFRCSESQFEFDDRELTDCFEPR
jgi:hypothetical protein